MKSRTLIECTIDLANPVTELAAVISAVLACHPDTQADILHAIDHEIGAALANIEAEESKEDAADGGDGSR
jgi:hypothetical protein